MVLPIANHKRHLEKQIAWSSFAATYCSKQSKALDRKIEDRKIGRNPIRKSFCRTFFCRSSSPICTGARMPALDCAPQLSNLAFDCARSVIVGYNRKVELHCEATTNETMLGEPIDPTERRHWVQRCGQHRSPSPADRDRSSSDSRHKTPIRLAFDVERRDRQSYVACHTFGEHCADNLWPATCGDVIDNNQWPATLTNGIAAQDCWRLMPIEFCRCSTPELHSIRFLSEV